MFQSCIRGYAARHGSSPPLAKERGVRKDKTLNVFFLSRIVPCVCSQTLTDFPCNPIDTEAQKAEFARDPEKYHRYHKTVENSLNGRFRTLLRDTAESDEVNAVGVSPAVSVTAS